MGLLVQVNVQCQAAQVSNPRYIYKLPSDTKVDVVFISGTIKCLFHLAPLVTFRESEPGKSNFTLLASNFVHILVSIETFDRQNLSADDQEDEVQ